MAPTIFSGLSFRLFVGSQKKLKYVTEDPPAKDTTNYDDSVASDLA